MVEAFDFAAMNLPGLLPDEKSAVTKYIAHELLSHKRISEAWDVLAPFCLSNKFDWLGTRRLLEYLSASGLTEQIHQIFDAARNDQLSIHGKRAAQSFALTTARFESEWISAFADETAKQALSPLDSYRAAFQIPERADIQAGLAFALSQAQRGDDYWTCDRAAAAFFEAMGRTEDALDAHHRATVKEFRRQGIPEDLVKRRQIGDVKISCIVISYNDGPLVKAWCQMVAPHCDQIVINDGGSTDNTVELFEEWGRENNFDVCVIRDQQYGNHDRSLTNKNEYRWRALGGIAAFQPERRRTTTLIRADHEYILMLDLDDVVPPFPNMKTIVTGSYGVEIFLGWKGEIIPGDGYREIIHQPEIAGPILFKANKYYAYAGVASEDEYLARLDKDIRSWGSRFATKFASYCFSYWHLKFLFDDRRLDEFIHLYGQPFSMEKRFDNPFQSFTLPSLKDGE